MIRGEPRYSVEEIDRRGMEVYDRIVGPLLEAGHRDRIVGEVAGDLGEVVLAAGDEGEAGAGGVEGSGDRRADAAAGAGDDGGAPGERALSHPRRRSSPT